MHEPNKFIWINKLSAEKLLISATIMEKREQYFQLLDMEM